MEWTDSRIAVRGFAALTMALILAAPSCSNEDPTILIPLGSVWSYRDDGVDLGTDWIRGEYRDSDWPAGPAKLGYGQGDEKTVIGYGPDPDNKYMTAYFRKRFQVDDPTRIQAASLNLLRDDGAIVYINGAEVFRSNMPEGPVTFQTDAATTGGARNVLYPAPIDPGVLVAGENTIAVEVHQVSKTSGDLQFDLELTTNSQAADLLVPPMAVWKYRDDGADLSTAWRVPDYPDETWKSGPARLGYGNKDEATVIDYGEDPSNRPITIYFRHSFTVLQPAQYRELHLALSRDDGAVVYLNGVEVMRSNLPRTQDYRTPAISSVEGESENLRYPVAVPSSLLVAGSNVLAVEVHQSSPDSTDLAFELALSGSRTVTLQRSPYLQSIGPTRAIVRWNTGAPDPGRVLFGLSPDALDQVVVDPVLRRAHEVTLTGLSPGVRYYYAVETGTRRLAGADTRHSFVTAPPAEIDSTSRIWVMGDSGTGTSKAHAVREGYQRFAGPRPADLLLLLGDNGYPNGAEFEYQIGLFDMYRDELCSIPVWPAYGNHDGRSASSSSQTGTYYDVFSLPKGTEAGGVASGTEAYYSFDRGNIHFICLDSDESDRSPGGPMLTWLEQDLTASPHLWKIAYWHHAPHSRGRHNSDEEQEMTEMREWVLPILEKHGVDLVLAGHSHSYERSFLIHGFTGISSTFTSEHIVQPGNGRLEGDGAYAKLGEEPRGTVYIVAGASGEVESGPLDHPAMYASLQELGSLVIDVHGTRLDASYIGVTGSVLDHFTILKGKDQPRYSFLDVIRALKLAGGLDAATSGDVMWLGLPQAGGRISLDTAVSVARSTFLEP